MDHVAEWLKVVSAGAPAIASLVPVPFAGAAISLLGGLAGIAADAIAKRGADLEELKLRAQAACADFMLAVDALPGVLAANDAAADAEVRK